MGFNVKIILILNVGGSKMHSAKREVEELLKHVPDSASYEDIQYRIYVRQKIAQGEADAEAGRVLTQEETEKRMEKWLKD